MRRGTGVEREEVGQKEMAEKVFTKLFFVKLLHTYTDNRIHMIYMYTILLNVNYTFFLLSI